MMRRPHVAFLLMAGLLVTLLTPSMAGAQGGKSTALAKELASVLDSGKLSAIAARLPDGKDHYVAALYFAGSQMLVVTARYTPPEILDERLAKREYRDVYLDLNTASDPKSRESIEDFGVDGIVGKRGGGLGDTYQPATGKQVVFDGEWGKQQLSEDAYQKALASADEAYAQVLTALLAEAKRTK
jgi:hypothetical protein